MDCNRASRAHRDPRLSAGPPARPHRQAAARKQAHPARRVSDRQAVRSHDPGTPPGGTAELSARTQLGTLEASGLIEIAALLPELEYLFRHALIQEAAYSSLLKQDRRTLHRAAAETILLLHPDRERELAGVIGMHFEQAGDTAQAAQHLVLAGEHALER